MTIICRVCAVFRHPDTRAVLFEVGPKERCQIIKAPDCITLDPYFGVLVSDGVLEAVQSVSQKRVLENDPMAGHDASGRKLDATKQAGNDAASGADPDGAKSSGRKPGRRPKHVESSAPVTAGADAEVAAAAESGEAAELSGTDAQ